jgi:ADP-ribosylglycohydrolase
MNVSLDDPKIKSIARKLTINTLLPIVSNKARNNEMCSFSVLNQYPKEALLLSLNNDFSKGSKSVGSFLGILVSDILLLPWRGLELQNISDKTRPVNLNITKDIYDNQYSEHTSIALVLAESLLVQSNLVINDFKVRCFHWWMSGYCNGLKSVSNCFNTLFTNTIANIISKKQYEYVESGKSTNTYSLTRVAPIVIFTQNHPEWCILMSQLASYSLDGTEISAGCTATLSYILFRLINNQDTIEKNPENFKKELINILNDWKELFHFQLITHPWRSNQDNHSEYLITTYNILDDICQSKPTDPELNQIWNWKNNKLDILSCQLVRKNHIRYATDLDALSFDYIPDCLALGIHLAYHHKNPSDYLDKLKSMGGNTSTIGIVTGQIIGSYYGHKIFQTNEIFKEHYRIINNQYKDRVLTIASLLYLRAK